jgi:hypothetical protein
MLDHGNLRLGVLHRLRQQHDDSRGITNAIGRPYDCSNTDPRRRRLTADEAVMK